MQPGIQVTTQSAQLALGQNRVLRNTYMLLGLSMIPTVIGAVVGINTNFAFLAQYPVMGPLLMFAVMIGAMFGIAALRNSVWGVVAMLAFTFLMGWWL
jgi:modulator of FtsH protease